MFDFRRPVDDEMFRAEFASLSGVARITGDEWIGGLPRSVRRVDESYTIEKHLTCVSTGNPACVVMEPLPFSENKRYRLRK